eukprot:8117322-Pyramimonas_sp.AAC.1
MHRCFCKTWKWATPAPAAPHLARGAAALQGLLPPASDLQRAPHCQGADRVSQWSSNAVNRLGPAKPGPPPGPRRLPTSR